MWPIIRKLFQTISYRFYWWSRGRHQQKKLEVIYDRVLGAADEGDLASAVARCDASLTVAKHKRDYTEYVNLLLLRAELAFKLHNPDDARKIYEECLEICRPQRVDWGTAAAIEGLGRVAAWYDKHREALALHVKSLELLESAGFPLQRFTCRIHVARLLQIMGDTAKAREYCEEALKLAITSQELEWEASALSMFGAVEAAEGRIDQARACYEKCLEIQSERNDRPGIAAALTSMGAVCDAAEHAAANRIHLEQGLALHRALREPGHESSALNNLGQWYLRDGHPERARDLICQSLLIKRDLSDKWGTIYSLEALAMVESSIGRDETAATLMGASRRLREETESTMEEFLRHEYERAVTTSREAIGERLFQVSHDRGHAMGFEDAVKFALNLYR